MTDRTDVKNSNVVFFPFESFSEQKMIYPNDKFVVIDGIEELEKTFSAGDIILSPGKKRDAGWGICSEIRYLNEASYNNEGDNLPCGVEDIAYAIIPDFPDMSDNEKFWGVGARDVLQSVLSYFFMSDNMSGENSDNAMFLKMFEEIKGTAGMKHFASNIAKYPVSSRYAQCILRAEEKSVVPISILANLYSSLIKIVFVPDKDFSIAHWISSDSPSTLFVQSPSRYKGKDYGTVMLRVITNLAELYKQKTIRVFTKQQF